MKGTKYKLMTIIALLAMTTIMVFTPEVAAASPQTNPPSSVNPNYTTPPTTLDYWMNPNLAKVDNVGNIDTTNSAFGATAAVGIQQTFSGYGFDVNVPDASIISSVKVRLDVLSFTGSSSTATELIVEISPDGGANFYTGTGGTFVTAYGFLSPGESHLIETSTWGISWTTSNIDNIVVRVTKNNALSMVYLDYIPVIVTYTPSSVVPEYALGGLGALAVTFAALVIFMKRSSIPSFKR